jgi:hypothetical protein
VANLSFMPGAARTFTAKNPPPPQKADQLKNRMDDYHPLGLSEAAGAINMGC